MHQYWIRWQKELLTILCQAKRYSEAFTNNRCQQRRGENLRRICPCTAPIATFSPTVEDCGGDTITCERCVNQKSEDLEDVSTGQRAASSSAVYTGEVFNKEDAAPNGSPKCFPYENSGSSHTNLNCRSDCSRSKVSQWLRLLDKQGDLNGSIRDCRGSQ